MALPKLTFFRPIDSDNTVRTWAGLVTPQQN